MPNGRPMVFVLTASEAHDDFPGERFMKVCETLDGAKGWGDRYLPPSSKEFGAWTEPHPGHVWHRQTHEPGGFQEIKRTQLEP